MTVAVGSSAGQFGFLDTATGTVSGTFATHVFFDIAIEQGTGDVFAVTGSSSLYSVDTTAQTSSLIGATGVFVNALAFNSAGTLFGSGYNTLYTIDLSTGVATAIGPIGGYNSSGDIAFDDTGALFGTSTSPVGDTLFSIDTATGAGTAIGDIGFSGVYGLVFADGTLFGLTDTNELISIDRTTGAGTLSKSFTLSGKTYGAALGISSAGGGGAVSPVPIPPALPLLLGALAGLGLVSRRHRSGARAA